MVSDNEKLALLPIVFLAVLYLGRDILRFNKLNIRGFCKIKLTRPQVKVAFLCYPMGSAYLGRKYSPKTT